MSTVKKPPGRSRGEVTVDDVVDVVTIRRVAEACGLSPCPPHATDRIEEKR
jgi:hypothetical protein